MTSGLTFCVFDDDPFILHLLTKVLTEAGHKVFSSASSAEALEVVGSHRPDCVLVDIMMPEMDGLALCRAIRAAPELVATKVIVVSGKAYDADRRRAREAGAHGYITKPVERDSFLAQIGEVMADRLELTYWGVRGTLPVPGRRSLRYGGNTACVTLRLPNHDLFIFDAGTGIRELSNALMARKERVTAKIFISHPHWDHVNALPFFMPLYVQGNEFEICGASQGPVTMRELISAQMDGVYFPVTIREFAARTFFRNMGEGIHQFDAARVDTMLLHHPGDCLGYRLHYSGRSVAYINDNEIYPADHPRFSEHYLNRLITFVQGADVLIADCTYTDEQYPSRVDWGHSAVSQVVDLAHRAEVGALHLFHHDPDQDDEVIDRKLAAARQKLEQLESAVDVRAPAEGEVYRV